MHFPFSREQFKAAESMQRLLKKKLAHRQRALDMKSRNFDEEDSGKKKSKKKLKVRPFCLIYAAIRKRYVFVEHLCQTVLSDFASEDNKYQTTTRCLHYLKNPLELLLFPFRSAVRGRSFAYNTRRISTFSSDAVKMEISVS